MTNEDQNPGAPFLPPPLRPMAPANQGRSDESEPGGPAAPATPQPSVPPQSPAQSQAAAESEDSETPAAQPPAPRAPAFPVLPPAMPPAGPGGGTSAAGSTTSDSGTPTADSGSAGPSSDAPTPQGALPDAQLAGLALSVYRYGESEGEPAAASVTVDAAGATQLHWPLRGEPGLYRVVRGDGTRPHNPEDFAQVARTASAAAVDAEEPRAAVRYFQVWFYPGATADQICTAQPVLHAQARQVVGVRDAHLDVDAPNVVGRWTVLPGTVGVHVYRSRPDRAASAAGDPRYRIAGAGANRGGFNDADTTPGERYVYQIMAQVTADGQSVMSDPLRVDIEMPVTLSPVTDLEYQAAESGGRSFDLLWTPPRFGRVEIYRTLDEPVEGFTDASIDEGRLAAGGGLQPEDRLSYPVEELPDGRHVMRSVPWPAGWTRAYFTPVALHGGQARVGRVIGGVSVDPVTDTRLVERVGRRHIGFAWPEGADVVRVYEALSGTPVENVLAQPAKIEIDKSQYLDRGSLTIEGYAGQAALTYYLVSGVFSGGEVICSAPVALECPPVTVLGYEVSHTGLSASGAWQVFVRVLAQVEIARSLRFAVVYNEDRMPLHIDDGVQVTLFNPDEGNQPTGRLHLNRIPAPGSAHIPYCWFSTPAFTQAPGGFIRLFADLPAEDLQSVALLDPDVMDLDLYVAGMNLFRQQQGGPGAPGPGGPGMGTGPGSAPGGPMGPGNGGYR